jgi:hypothetical protein
MTTGTTITIPPPNMRTALFRIKGTSPLVQCKFSEKAKQAIRETQEAGTTARGKKKREPKNFDEVCAAAVHRSDGGWVGIPAGAFRSAMISACRLVGFKMTLAKLSVFVEADGLDADDGTPLVKLIAGDYERVDMHVRNATGVIDLRTRPMWREWQADVRVRWDADQFKLNDIANLLARVGMQVGIGEGRADSRASAGMGWGMFELAGEAS